MNAFPDTVHFKGLNRPVRMEVAMHDLRIEGRIPADVTGTFFRSVPDPLFPPLRNDDVILSADGMISKIEIRNGRARYVLRYVQNERYKAQMAAGRAIFGAYRNPYTDDPAAAGVDRSATNTTPVWHGGRLFMTKEDGRAWEINPHTLETLGKWQGRDYSYCWYLTIDPNGGKPLHAGPAGVSFNMVLTVDMSSAKIDAYSIGPGLAIGEPVHVPSSQPNSRGWLLAEICREVGVDQYEQEIWVLSADDLNAGPVAQIKLPVAGRPQLHGCWVGADSLAQARVLR